LQIHPAGGLPEEWGFEKDEIFKNLTKNIFSQDWIIQVSKAYWEFISLMTKKT
jgi:hypothetical protein